MKKFILITNIRSSNGMLIVFNAAGQQVKQQQITVTTGLNQYQLNMSSLVSGFYNLVVIQNGTAGLHVKIIRQ